MPSIDNYADIIDSRDIIARIEELTSDDFSSSFDPDELAELRALENLASEASDYAEDWLHGEVLIRDSYFQNYAMELAYDLGMIADDASWPMTCIDWEKAARGLQMDYTSVEFDGVTYWVR